MTAKTIPALPAAGALAGTEPVETVQGPNSVKTTVQDIANLAPAPVVPVGANPTATAGPTAVNGAAGTFMRSDGSPAIQKATNAQFGLVEGDGTTITIVAGVASSLVTAPVGANPTATAGPTAVNGAAATFMRSDGAPAIQKATNAQFGLAEGDGTTITAVAGVLSAITTSGGVASYTEGTWTPSDLSGAGLTFTNNACTYTKVGRMVTLRMDITFPATGNTNPCVIGTLPFSIAQATTFYIAQTSTAAFAQILAGLNTNFIVLQTFAQTVVAVTNANMTGARIKLIVNYVTA